MHKWAGDGLQGRQERMLKQTNSHNGQLLALHTYGWSVECIGRPCKVTLITPARRCLCCLSPTCCWQPLYSSAKYRLAWEGIIAIWIWCDMPAFSITIFDMIRYIVPSLIIARQELCDFIARFYRPHVMALNDTLLNSPIHPASVSRSITVEPRNHQCGLQYLLQILDHGRILYSPMTHHKPHHSSSTEPASQRMHRRWQFSPSCTGRLQTFRRRRW